MNRSVINYHIQNNLILRVERKLGTEPYIEGFPICLSEKFLLMTVINDFHDEGYTIIRAEDIKRAYSKESISFYEKMCKNEGLGKRAVSVISDLSCEMSIVSDLNYYKGVIEFVCEQENGEEDFYLGKIKEIFDGKVAMRTFDLSGNWGDKDEMISYEKITRISFGDNYSKVYYKYMH